MDRAHVTARAVTAVLVAAPLMGCPRPPPDADDEFDDAMVGLLLAFEEDDEALAQALLDVEDEVYTSMDVESRSSLDRSLSPRRLTWDDVEAIEHPDRDPALTIPVCVAGVSPYTPEQHKQIQLLDDHTPVEPYSPEYYVREFLEGEDCWGDRSCSLLRTHNDVLKTNILLTVYYEFYKDFRWLDLSTDGEPRWAYVARSWQSESFWSDSGKSAFLQSFTIEAWLPRDGRGWVDDGSTEWTADSTGGGTLRVLSVWGETKIGLDASDDQIAGTTRLGIDKNFKAADDWLEETLQ